MHYCEDSEEALALGHCTELCALESLRRWRLSSARRLPGAVSAELDRRRSGRLEKDGADDKEEACVKRCPPAAPPRAPRRAARPAPAVRRGGRRRGGRENFPCARPAVASGRRGQERAEGSGGPVRARPAAQRSARALSDSAPPPRLPHLATTQSGVSSPNRRGRPVHLLARRAQPQQLRQRPAPVAAGRVRLGEQPRHLQALFSYYYCYYCHYCAPRRAGPPLIGIAVIILLLFLFPLCASESRAATAGTRPPARLASPPPAPAWPLSPWLA